MEVKTEKDEWQSFLGEADEATAAEAAGCRVVAAAAAAMAGGGRRERGR